MGTGIVTQARLDALRTSFSFIFMRAMQAQMEQEDWSDEFCTEVPSDSASNVYGWIAQQLKLRRWEGSRVAQNLSEHVKELFNLPFEGTIEVDRDKVEDDKLGFYVNVELPQLAEATRKHPNQLVTEFLQSNPTTWDGKALFATDHPNFNATGAGATTYGNEFANTDLTEDNVWSIWSTMAAYIGEDGKPLAVVPKKLWVPPQLWKQAKKVCESEQLITAVRNVAGTEIVAAAAERNTAQGLLVPKMIPDFAGLGTVWYIGDDSGILKPLVRQVRRAPEFVAITRADSDSVFEKRKYKFGVDYRTAVGETLPWKIGRAYSGGSPA